MSVFCVLAVCISSLHSTKRAQADEPMKYEELVTQAKDFWKKASHRRVLVDWNSKAPELTRLKIEAVVDVQDETLAVYSISDSNELAFAAYFHEREAVIADGHLQTLSKVAPFLPADGGTTTGLPAELLLLRLLLLANSLPTLAKHGQGETIRLDKSEEQALARALFPDTPGLFTATRKPETFLRSSSSRGELSYDWLDHGGVIFHVEAAKCGDLIEKRRRDFQWTNDRSRTVPVPRITQLVDHLIEAKVVDTKEGSPLSIGKGGTRLSAEVKRDEIATELLRVKVAGHTGVITVSQAAPISVKSVSVLRDSAGSIVGRAASLADGSKSLCLVGQNWLVTIAFPDRTSANVEKEVENWLKKLLAQDE